MTPEDIVRTYGELAKILRIAGLEWIVEEVEETIHAGRPVEKQTRIFKEQDQEAEPNHFVSPELNEAGRAGKPTWMMAIEP
jgi:hypothetical protein